MQRGQLWRDRFLLLCHHRILLWLLCSLLEARGTLVFLGLRRETSLANDRVQRVDIAACVPQSTARATISWQMPTVKDIIADIESLNTQQRLLQDRPVFIAHSAVVKHIRQHIRHSFPSLSKPMILPPDCLFPIIESDHLIERIQVRFPRSKKNRIRKKWAKRTENWVTIPRQEVFMIS